MTMLEMVTIKRLVKNPWHGKVLDVAESLSDEFGSSTNAIVLMVRGSPLFKNGMAKMDVERRRRLRKRGAS